MADRTINFGSDSTEATYQIQDDDPAGGGDFVIRDTDANLAILSYDQVNDEWSLGASADFDTNNITNVATLDATTLNVDTLQGADIANAAADEALLSDGNGNLQFGAAGGVEEVSTFGNLPAVDPPQLAYVVDEDQYYHSNPNFNTFDITKASLDTSITTQAPSPRGFAWNNDGSRLYETGNSSDKIFQSTLSTPFDITTASFDTSIDTQDSSPFGIAWNDDGSRLYEVGGASDKIYQSTLSTPFDISTASFDTSISTQDSEPYDIEWNNDGSRLYELGSNSNQIYQSTVSTPFDITTASFDTSISTQDSDPQGIAWNDDGSRLYEVGDGSEQIYQSTLSTPFDITTASFDTSINSQNSNPWDIAWNNDGSRFYELGFSGDQIIQYNNPIWVAF